MDSHADRFQFPVHLAGSVASRILNGAADGRVAALFKSSFYVETEAGLVCIGNEDLGSSPLNVVTMAPASTNWPASGLRLNTKVTISANILRVGYRFSFLLSDAVTWSPDPVPDSWEIPDLERGVKAFREACVDHVPAEGLGPFLIPQFRPDRIQSVCRIAEAPMSELGQWLVTAFRKPYKRILRGLRGVHPLVGLGPGLTPSGDDFIGGMMIALHGLGETDICRQLWGQVRQCAEEAGNPISSAHLNAASQGEGSAGIHRALSAILDGRREAIRDSLAEISPIGHTSGWDAMAGVIVALESWLEARPAQPLR